jgi:hypothetical protein
MVDDDPAPTGPHNDPDTEIDVVLIVSVFPLSVYESVSVQAA